jgi:hypothetical protein
MPSIRVIIASVAACALLQRIDAFHYPSGARNALAALQHRSHSRGHSGRRIRGHSEARTRSTARGPPRRAHGGSPATTPAADDDIDALRDAARAAAGAGDWSGAADLFRALAEVD